MRLFGNEIRRTKILWEVSFWQWKQNDCVIVTSWVSQAPLGEIEAIGIKHGWGDDESQTINPNGMKRVPGETDKECIAQQTRLRTEPNRSESESGSKDPATSERPKHRQRQNGDDGSNLDRYPAGSGSGSVGMYDGIGAAVETIPNGLVIGRLFRGHWLSRNANNFSTHLNKIICYECLCGGGWWQNGKLKPTRIERCFRLELGFDICCFRCLIWNEKDEEISMPGTPSRIHTEALKRRGNNNGIIESLLSCDLLRRLCGIASWRLFNLLLFPRNEQQYVTPDQPPTNIKRSV